MPHAAFQNVSALEKLELEGNELTGALPRALCSLSNLTRLSLSNNQLTGEHPLWHVGELSSPYACAKATDLSVFMLHVLRFEATSSLLGQSGSPPKHQSCVYISEAHKDDKQQMSVMLSPCLHAGLVHIRSGFSVLKASGSVTSRWCLRAVLCRLVVRVSPAGSLPGCLGQLENLEVLHLAGNELTGRYASAMLGFCLMDSPLQKPCTQMSYALISWKLWPC